jgi:hypothetical protein
VGLGSTIKKNSEKNYEEKKEKKEVECKDDSKSNLKMTK